MADNLAQNILNLICNGNFNLGNFTQEYNKYNDNKNNEQLTVEIVDGICDLIPLDEKIREQLAKERNNDKLEKYIHIAQRIISQHDATSDQQQKVRLIKEFIGQAREYFPIDVCYKYPSVNTEVCCLFCGSVWDDSFSICENCNSVMKYGDELDTGVKNKKKEKIHSDESFVNYLYKNYLGNISPGEIETLRKGVIPKIVKYFNDNSELERTNKNMIYCLKEIKEKSHLKNITILCYLTWGLPKPKLKQSQIDCIMYNYNFVMTAYEQIKKNNGTNRSSALNSPYVLGKILTRIGIDFDENNLKSIETDSIQIEHDQLWIQICEKNQWEI